ncbi:MAG: ABC transporter permease [Chloroflexota bacterium]
MKKFLQPLSTAWMSVTTHKLRSFLTVLGVVIGVAAVITLMSIGRGTQETILSRLSGLGSNLIFVQPGATTQGGVRGASGSASTLTLEDALAIADEVPYVVAAAPSSTSGLQVIAGGQNMFVRVTGVTPDYQQVYNLQVADGDFISQYIYDRSMKVAVLGSNVAETLFGTDEPVGQTIRAGNNILQVIGVLQSQGASMLGSADDTILIPLSALQIIAARQTTTSGGHVVSTIAVAADSQDHVKDVMDGITFLLQNRHQIALGADNDFSVTSLEDLADTISSAMSSVTMLLAAIAGISLLVGGIGVMNIMLVSVLERTREIGIRKALGARDRDIWVQFLIEAAFLTFTGGVIGVTIGWGAAYLVTRFGAITTLVSADIVILAVAVSVGIGLFFGFYPAWNASRLNPIEALRSE